MRMRGRAYPELSEALNKFLESGEPLSNLHAIHMATVEDPDYYGAPSHGLSIEALGNLSENERVMPRTVRVVRNFLAIHAADLLPPESMEKVPLNLQGFFGMPPDKLRLAGSAIDGCFQSYAISTTIPGMVRRGKIVFAYDAKQREIRIEEEQYRPRVGPVDELRMEWEGYCVARGQKYFAVLRTKVDFSESTPLFYVFDIPPDSQIRKISRLRGVSMGLDPRQNWPSFPTVYLERVPRDSEVLVDFCKVSDVDRYIIDQIQVIKGSLI